MARYRGRRRSYGGYGGYGGYRRRRNPRAILKAVVVLAVVTVCVALIVQSQRLQEAYAQVSQLQQQVASLQTSGGTDAGGADAAQSQPLDYQTLYPEMRVDHTGEFAADVEKAVYLTFDDGPSANTAAILDALAARGQKATFFVTGKNIAGNEALLQRIVNEGHALGIHGYSHDYAQTYASVEAFLEDFHAAYQAVYEACGVYPTMFRFPGGSINAYNRAIYPQVIAEMLRRGFVYYDWNVSGGDADAGALAATIQQTVTQGVTQTSHPIVLLHDVADKASTVEALPGILDELTGLGYYSDRLTPTVRPVTFDYT